MFHKVREKDYSITRPYYVFRKMRYLSGTMSLREDDSLWALRLAADRWLRSWECSGAVCRLPVRKLSLLTAYVTRHTLFGCVCVCRTWGSHPMSHTVRGKDGAANFWKDGVKTPRNPEIKLYSWSCFGFRVGKNDFSRAMIRVAIYIHIFVHLHLILRCPVVDLRGVGG